MIIDIQGKPFEGNEGSKVISLTPPKPKQPQIDELLHPELKASYIRFINFLFIKYDATPEVFEKIEGSLHLIPANLVDLILQESFHRRGLTRVLQEIKDFNDTHSDEEQLQLIKAQTTNERNSERISD